MKNFYLRFSSLIVATFILGGFFVPSQAQAAGVLGVTQITAIQTYAQNDNTFEHGWRWVFDVTVPDNETILKMKFDNWVGTLGNISTDNNMRFYSSQSLNASTTNSSIMVTAAGSYSNPMNLLSSADLNESAPGRQIQITVEMKVPVGTPGGSYSTSYGIQSNPPAPVNITASSGTMIYQGSVPTIIPVYSPNITPIVSPVCTTDATNSSLVGDYISSCSGADDPNYLFTYVNGLVTVTPAEATITASDATMTYGGIVPTINPIYNPDISPSTQPICTTDATNSSPVGDYTSNCSGASDPNYTFNYISGLVYVGQATSVTTISCPVNVVYTGLAQTPCTVSVVGDGGLNLTPDPVYMDNINAGTATASYTYAGDVNYIGSSDSKNFEIIKVDVVVTASDETMVYGGTAPIITATYNPEITPTIPAICSTEVTSASPVGTYPSSCLGASDSNHNFTYVNGSVSVIKASAEVSLGDLSQVYDGTPKSATITTIPADLSTDVTYDNLSTVPTDVGLYDVVATITDSNYIGSANGTLEISSVSVEASVSAENKIYDGTTAATITNCVLNGVLPGDDVACSVTVANFDNKNVGTGKLVTATGITLSGADAGNYTLSNTTATTNADITVKTLTVSANGGSKVYDGNTAARQVTLSTDAFLGDMVNATGISFYFVDRNVGNNKPISVEGIEIGGTDAYNYVLAGSIIDGTADIITKDLTVDGLTAQNKVYNGNTDATLTGAPNLVGVIGSDNVYLDGTPVGTFANVGPADGIAVNVSGLSLAGIDIGNYTLTQPTLYADITPIPVPTLTSADITSDSLTIGNLSGATLATNDTAGVMHTLNVDSSSVVVTNGPIPDGEYGFKLQADSTQQTTLTNYFAGKGWPAEYVTQINKEIAGTDNFFYFKVDGTNYSLIDGFQKALGAGDQPLVIDDTYPAGTYTYIGAIGAQNVTVTLTITKPAPEPDPVIPPVVDTTAPEVLSSNPIDDSTGVPIEISPTLIFSEALDSNTVKTGNIELRTYSDNEEVDTSINLSTDGTVVTFTPTTQLSTSMQYYFFIGTGVKDITGNKFAADTWYAAQKANHEFTTAN